MTTTHAKTGGQCMPCFHGRRSDIEAERRRREERKGDPFVRLFNGLRDRACARGADDAMALPPDELTFYAMSVLLSDLHRGGFQTYFDTTSREEQEAAEVGLQRIATPQILAHFLEAQGLSAQDHAWLTQRLEENPDLEEQVAAPNQARLDELCAYVLSEADELYRRLESFAVSHRLVEV